MPKTRQRAPKVRDIALIVGRSEQGDGFHVLRRRGADQPVELGTVRPLREGKAIDGEVVSLRQRKDFPFAFDVKTELPAPEERQPGDGPPRVSTDQYRRGWDEIWGRKRLPAAAGANKPN